MGIMIEFGASAPIRGAAGGAGLATIAALGRRKPSGRRLARSTQDGASHDMTPRPARETGIATIAREQPTGLLRGTRVLTSTGLVPVEQLRPGDRIVTRDNGLQPLRWLSARRVSGQGAFAPVVIPANAFGRHGEVCMAPGQGVFMQGACTEMLLGRGEVLVRASDLADDTMIRRAESDSAEYWLVLFNMHQVIYAEGLETESFHPHLRALAGMEPERRAHLIAHFPEFDHCEPDFGPSVRPVLKGHEARLVSGAAKRLPRRAAVIGA